MKRYENMKFDNLSGEYINGAKEVMSTFANNPYDFVGNVVLSGNVGTGKTALCHALMNEAFEAFKNQKEKIQTEWVKYSNFSKGNSSISCFKNDNFEQEHCVMVITSAKGIVDSIKNSWRDKEENDHFIKCKRANVLVIDEVGLQYGTEMERIEMFELVDCRYNSMLPTVFTSNFFKDELKRILGQRIHDRIFSECRYFEFKETSKRF